MGVDLTIYLDRHRFGLRPQFGGFHSLKFEQEYPLFEQFATFDPPKEIRVRPQPVPDDFTLHIHDGEAGLIETRTDDHGDPLTWCTIGELATLQTSNRWNRAILAMLRELPPDMLAVLNWSW